jgi:dipeptidyl aminopeptidase/acylaminoacyl peptidase
VPFAPTRLLLALVLLASALPAAAQSGPRRALTQADWDRWRSITGTTISPAGDWVAYSLVPQVGDGELVIRSTRGTTEWRVPRGFIGRPQLVAGFQGDSTAAPVPPAFSPDGRWVVTQTTLPRAEYEAAVRRNRRAPVRNGMAIVRVADGRATPVARVRSFRVPRDGASVVAYLLDPDDASAMPTRDSSAQAVRSAPTTAATPGGAPRPVGDSTGRGRRREHGATLVLRELATGRETRIADVVAYVLDDSAKWLGYTVASRTAGRDGAYVRRVDQPDAEIALMSGAGDYRALTFDRTGTQAAFVSNAAEFTRERPRAALYLARLSAGNGSARPVVAADAIGKGMVIADNRLAFTRSGGTLLFGYSSAPLDSIPADSLVDKAVFDLWHWKDLRLQPQQRVDAARERNRSFGAVWQVGAARMVKLASDSFPNVQVSDDGRTAMLVTDVPYAIEAMWGEGGSDLYAVDATTGARTLVTRKLRYQPQLSPGGRYIAYFEGGQWWTYDVARGRRTELTRRLAGVRFDQETFDTPDIPAPWGLAGWTNDDRSMLAYDRFDLWELDPSGMRAPRMVTDSAGRRDSTVLRLVDLDADDRFIDPARPMLLRAFNEETKASGFYEDRLDAAGAPRRIVMADVAFGMPQRARRGEQLVLTRGTFQDFPDLHTGTSLASLTRISNGNPQQAEYGWGSVELVKWTSADGVPLHGLLYKPADFDPSKKYPMVAYFYEQLSQNLHQYVAPGGRNVVNPTHYTSNGYLVFEPDIHYETGYPGPSAYKSVVPGVQSLVARGFVDPKGLALQGQSWGGYQALYIVTQTPMFSAVMAGAPVANMFSAYGGIRWQTGVARAFQYEHTQSRIGGSIWQYPMRYLENSPLFWADRITTPLMMMHNDGDGSVPWYQGIEMFVAMRRLNKEAYLVNYNGDEHNPTKRANQKDVAMRMQQFFDHHLRGAPAPEWMVQGIPYRQKGRDQLAPAAVRAGAAATETTSGAARP